MGGPEKAKHSEIKRKLGSLVAPLEIDLANKGRKGKRGGRRQGRGPPAEAPTKKAMKQRKPFQN